MREGRRKGWTKRGMRNPPMEIWRKRNKELDSGVACGQNTSKLFVF